MTITRFAVLLLCTLLTTGALAQSPIARFKFEDAEAAFANKDYATALLRLEEAEQEFGAINPPILYLRIMTRNEALNAQPSLDFDNLERLREDCMQYLREYGTLEVLLDQAREVYRVSESLSQYPATRLAFAESLVAVFREQEALEQLQIIERMRPLSGADLHLWAWSLHRIAERAAYRTASHDDALTNTIQAFHAHVEVHGGEPGHARHIAQIERYLRALDDYRAGRHADFTAKDYDAARLHYRRAAEAGNPMAMAELGTLYRDGQGGPQDYDGARRLFEQGAESDYSWAMLWLGVLHANGNGVPQDYATARQWYERAAHNGLHFAMDRLGDLYYFGRGVARDFAVARQWYEWGAALDNPASAYSLGLLYEHGRGVTQDYAISWQWYEKAAGQGHTGAMTNLGAYHGTGRGVARDDAKALEWYRKAADGGHVHAMSNIGLYYRHGRAVPQDWRAAVEWYEKAANRGHARSMKALAELYEAGGHGLKRDRRRAREWSAKAAAAGEQ